MTECDLTRSAAGCTEPAPTNLEQLVLQVQWLAQRVHALEFSLSQQQQTAPAPQTLTYHIDTLSVKELSGTLNIGVATIVDHGDARWQERVAPALADAARQAISADSHLEWLGFP